jgi:hypothetical protein
VFIHHAERHGSPTRRHWRSIWNGSAIAGFGASVLLGREYRKLSTDFWLRQYEKQEKRSCNAPDQDTNNEDAISDVCVVHCQ